MTDADQRPNHRRRSATRLAAVQALYEIEVSGAAVDPVLGEFIGKRWADAGGSNNLLAPDGDQLGQLVRGVFGRRSELDAVIEPTLTGAWAMGRLEILVRAILRAGAYELTAFKEVPAKAAINEYVDVAHAFYPGKEPAMVNAVLDRLARTLRPNERMTGSDDSALEQE
jgi:transcription antitermination protein NusB